MTGTQPQDHPSYPAPDSPFWATELGSYFADHPATWTTVVMTGHYWGLGNDIKEAYRNAGVRPRKSDAIGEWDMPVQAVVDEFGQVHWLPSAATLTWVQN